MEEYTGEFTALEARRTVALEKLQTATEPTEIQRLKDELVQIDSAMSVLGEEDA